MEGVWGAEQYNNHPMMTDPAAEHNTTLPFTRNAVGPMDYTPTAFTNSQHAHRTSHAHELALPVIFESACQHMADRPSAFRALPEKVKDFIAGLPTTWDDTKYLGGEPADFVILGRRKGDTWYVGGINGKATTREVKFTVPGNPGVQSCQAQREGAELTTVLALGSMASPHCNHIPQTWSLRDRKQDIEAGHARIHSQDDYSPVLGPGRLRHAHPPRKVM